LHGGLQKKTKGITARPQRLHEPQWEPGSEPGSGQLHRGHQSSQLRVKLIHTSFCICKCQGVSNTHVDKAIHSPKKLGATCAGVSATDRPDSSHLKTIKESAKQISAPLLYLFLLLPTFTQSQTVSGVPAYHRLFHKPSCASQSPKGLLKHLLSLRGI
jgi:hypothetical protein